MARSAAVSAGARVRGEQADFWLDEAAISSADPTQPCHDGRRPGCGGAGGHAPPCAAAHWISCRPIAATSAAAEICVANAPAPAPAPPHGLGGASGGGTSDAFLVPFVLCLVGLIAAAALGRLPGQAIRRASGDALVAKDASNGGAFDLQPAV